MNEPEINKRVNELLQEGSNDIYRILIHSVEKDLLERVLAHFKGNQFRASQALGISRFTLRKKLRAISSDSDLPENSEPEGSEELVGAGSTSH